MHIGIKQYLISESYFKQSIIKNSHCILLGEYARDICHEQLEITIYPDRHLEVVHSRLLFKEACGQPKHERLIIPKDKYRTYIISDSIRVLKNAIAKEKQREKSKQTE